ncbi:MAG TPA: PAS domain-containing sensor histidine kinase, partial [Candidatus Margulisbacteria bacterium]|nr:PAS domain-containing sensor histidine kinase [Candidatus Margulisiibacteriota bacterium]
LLRVEVGVVDEVEGLSGSMVRVRIADTGKGMSKDTRDNLFKPFFTTKENGTGLGLAVTRKIIEDHGGKISVESELGTGSNFNIYLPRK